jgi:hypothetical protein
MSGKYNRLAAQMLYTNSRCSRDEVPVDAI